MSDDVKTRILNSAKRLFALHGFAATSVRQICDEAGANVALVSYHFGGKEKLLFTLFEQVLPSPTLYEYIDEIHDPIKRLKTLICAFITQMNHNPEVGRIVQIEYLLQTDRVETLRETVFPLWKRWRQALEEAHEQGRLQFESLDAAMLQTMGAVIYPLTDIFVAPLLNEGKFSIEQQIRQRTRFILQGLGATGADLEDIVLTENGELIERA